MTHADEPRRADEEFGDTRLIELLRQNADEPARTGAADVGAALLNSRRYEVLFVDAALVEAGLTDLRRFADKRLSLVDAVSFAVIRSLALDGSFTFDRDFRDGGFAVYPDA